VNLATVPVPTEGNGNTWSPHELVIIPALKSVDGDGSAAVIAVLKGDILSGGSGRLLRPKIVRNAVEYDALWGFVSHPRTISVSDRDLPEEACS
jgi:hypothetical protein